MFNFFKKTKTAPRFILTKNFHRRDYYFTRNAEWGWLDQENVFVKDTRKSRVIPLDSWGLNIFVSANGDKTVEEFVYHVAALYEDVVPEDLEQTIIFELARLAESNFIAFSREKKQPEQAFNSPGLMPA